MRKKFKTLKTRRKNRKPIGNLDSLLLTLVQGSKTTESISSRFRLRDNGTLWKYFITANIMETQAPDLGLNSSVPPTAYSKYLLRTPAAYLKYLLLFLNFS